MTLTAATTEFLDKLTDSITQAGTLEELVRPLLELLNAVTGLESTYLTAIDSDAGMQRIVFARNSRQLRIPEGVSVAWEDTLCKRAMEEGVDYADDVADRWHDADAARHLGIATYASSPVRTRDGQLYGTLCAASNESRPLEARAPQVLQLFSRLIAQQIDRERLMQALQRANEALTVSAQTDATTRLPNRRALMDELVRRQSHLTQDDQVLIVAFIDLDGFKAINDHHGHDAGDRFLIAIGGRLQAVLRSGDFVARWGGDEFVVVCSPPAEMAEEIVGALPIRLQEAISGHFDLDGVAIVYGGASIGIATAGRDDADPLALLARADEAMYRIKHARRTERDAAPAVRVTNLV